MAVRDIWATLWRPPPRCYCTGHWWRERWGQGLGKTGYWEPCIRLSILTPCASKFMQTGRWSTKPSTWLGGQQRRPQGALEPLGCGAEELLIIGGKIRLWLLGLWIVRRERSKFWLVIFTEPQNLGVKDILIVRMDGIPAALRLWRPRRWYLTLAYWSAGTSWDKLLPCAHLRELLIWFLSMWMELSKSVRFCSRAKRSAWSELAMDWSYFPCLA